MCADWTRVRFLPQKRRLFVSFLNLSPCVVPQPSWLTSLVMQTYGGGEWWSLSLTLPQVKHTQVVWVCVEVAGGRWTCRTKLHLIPVWLAAMISFLSMKFQETHPWQQTLWDTPQGNILCWTKEKKSVLCFCRYFKDWINVKKKKKIFFLYFLCQESWSYLRGRKHNHVHICPTPSCLLFLLNHAIFHWT